MDIVHLSTIAPVLGVECVQMPIDEFKVEQKLEWNEKTLAESDGTLFEAVEKPIKLAKIDVLHLPALLPTFNMPGKFNYICKLLAVTAVLVVNCCCPIFCQWFL